MASTFTADAAKAGAPASHAGGKMPLVAHATYELTAAMVIGDVIKMVKLPKGAVVLDTLLVTDDLDTNGTPLIKLDVGYGGGSDYFTKDSTVGQAGGVARADQATAHPLELTAEDTIDITCSTAPATGVTGTVSLSVSYLTP